MWLHLALYSTYVNVNTEINNDQAIRYLTYGLLSCYQDRRVLLIRLSFLLTFIFSLVLIFFLHIFIFFLPSIFVSVCLPTAFLRWCRWNLNKHGTDDLPQTTDGLGQAKLHLQLPSVCGMAWRHERQLRQGTALPGRQRWGDVLWQ